MKIPKTIFILSLLTVALLSCTATQLSTPVDVDFPLKHVLTIPVDEAIKKVAVANTWMAVSTLNKVVAIDMATQEILWNIDFSVYTDIDAGLEFQIVNDTLVAVSTDQIILINKAGQRREITLGPVNSKGR